MTVTNMSLMTSHSYGGHVFTLVPGRRYLASRPMAISVRQRTFDVAIHDVNDGVRLDATPVMVVPRLTRDAADALINDFNDGESFRGRIWE